MAKKNTEPKGKDVPVPAKKQVRSTTSKKAVGSTTVKTEPANNLPEELTPNPLPLTPIFGFSKVHRANYEYGPDGSYFDQRMKRIGVTDHNNRCLVLKTGSVPDLVAPGGKIVKEDWFEEPLFYETNNGNIGIRFLDLDGKEQTYKPETGWRKPFYRERLRVPIVKPNGDTVKYYQPDDSGVHIFFPPQLVEKYKRGETLPRLYLTEGEIKAAAGTLAGLDIIGLPSIHAYKLKEENALHPDIYRAIWQFKPKELIILFDADTLTINWEKWQADEEHYDLAKRLNSFHSAAMNIRELTKNLDCDVYFADQSPCLTHPLFKIREAKGLDDLLEVAQAKEVIEDIARLTSARTYFSCINLSSISAAKLKQHFLLSLNNKRVPDVFFQVHRERLTKRDGVPAEIEFLFSGFRYKYDRETGELRPTGHPDSEKYVRVGPDYFKLIKTPNAAMQLLRRIIPWKKGEITDDYVKRGHPYFFDSVEKYDSFCNVPFNNGTYQQVINGNYNLYYKMEHELKQGEHPYTDMYLKHLFGDKVDVALDWLTLLYIKPLQMLPIICLVSRERETGKTKFIEWLQQIYGENANKIGNDELHDRFNDDYVSSLVIAIDEGFIEKKTVIEKLKSWSTANTAKLAIKGKSRQNISFFAKFIITSNDANDFIKIDSDETRFFVNYVKKPEKSDPDLLDKLVSEIPAFLYTLTTRTLTHPKVTRHWFETSLLKTEALTNVIDNTRNYAYKVIKRFISEKLLEFEELEIKMTLWHLDEMLKMEGLPYKVPTDTIERILKEDFKLFPGNVERYKFPQWKYDAENDFDIVELLNNFYNPVKKQSRPLRGRCYTFKATDFLKEAEFTPKMKEAMEKLTAIVDDEMPF